MFPDMASEIQVVGHSLQEKGVIGQFSSSRAALISTARGEVLASWHKVETPRLQLTKVHSTFSEMCQTLWKPSDAPIKCTPEPINYL